MYSRTENSQYVEQRCRYLKGEINEIMLRQSMQSLNNQVIGAIKPTQYNVFPQNLSCKCSITDEPIQHLTNCKNCGAPLKNHTCEYCGTQY